MSEPMSSGEIEDVLSSIRRLVSEDLRPVSQAGAAKPAAQVPAPGKLLLLTPALRVVSNTPAARPVPVADAPAQAAAPSAQAGKDWLPEVDEGALDDEWQQSDVTRVVSEIGAAVADHDGEWEAEGGEADMVCPTETVSWQAPEWVEEAELVEEPLTQAAAKALADAAEAAAVAEIKARVADADAGSEDVGAGDDAYFDEAVLRDLVRDLIREELSGTLGERITRNVRKLVRAEINRAMTARDFD